jgi:hypothetical protein
MSHIAAKTLEPDTIVATLSRFMRTNYGPEAETEARRHVITYNTANQHELADIWVGVLEALQKTYK